MRSAPPRRLLEEGPPPWVWLLLLLAFSLAVRFLLFSLPGNRIDLSNFGAWLGVAAERGPAGFYDPPNWSDYPPLNVYYFWLLGHVARLLGPESLAWFLKLPQNLLDLGIAALLYVSLARRFSPGVGLLGAAAYAFNPATIYDLAVWGQMDSFHTLLMVGALLALLGARWEIAAGLLALALLAKPQSVALLPVLAYAVLRCGGWRRALTSAAVGALVILLALLPFREANPVAFAWERLRGGYEVYAYNSLNAYNLWAALGFWKPDTARLFLGLSHQVWGLLAYGLLALYVVWRLHRRYDGEAAIFASFLLSFGLFMLLTRMHERYFFPALALLALGGLATAGAWALYLGLSLTSLAALAYVLPLLNQRAFIPDGHWSFYVLVPANIALFLYALASFHRRQGEAPAPTLEAEEAPGPAPEAPAEAGAGPEPIPDMSGPGAPGLERMGLGGQAQGRAAGPGGLGARERAALLGLVAFFLLAALWGLGSWRIPTSDWAPQGGQEALYLDLGAPQPIDSLYFLVQGPQPVKVEASCGQPGAWQRQGDYSGQGHWRSWQRLSVSCQSRYIRLAFQDSTAAIGEVALFAGSRRLPIQGVVSEGASPSALGGLADEQALVGRPPTFRQGTYFDEIYFVRTAEEHLRFQEPFEWTHPPLGKLIIGLGILYLGTNPLAWRLPGVVLAALMIPLVYLLARRLLGSGRAGLAAAALLTFEFMHYTEARLGTAEVSILFFVILMFYFFYRYFAGEPPAARAGGWAALLPRGRERDLFLSLLFFGFAFATKWVTAYGLAGMALLGLGLKLRERRVTPGEAIAVVGGAAAAGLVYLLSYIPYLMAGHDLSDLVQLQRSMFRYHSTLEATHPFSSPWWSWPLLLKPLWMANNRLDGQASVIVALGNPALWLPGPLLILLTAGLFLRRPDRRLAFIVVPFLAQWLLFVPIDRVLFNYHFFPNVLFMALAAALWLERLWDRWPEAAWGYLALSGFLFLAFYPVLSGLPADPNYWNQVKSLLPPPLG